MLQQLEREPEIVRWDAENDHMWRTSFGSAAFEVVQLAARSSLRDLTGIYVVQSSICDSELAVFVLLL